MGYTTNFTGELKFKKELTASQIAHLNNFLGQDRREIGFEDDNDVYEVEDEYWYHIDLELTKDLSGLRWNGAEKTYDLDNIINFVTKQMRKKYPDFELVGEMSAQGEEAGDRWNLVMKDGKAHREELKTISKECTCPRCGEKITKVLCSECEEQILIGDLEIK